MKTETILALLRLLLPVLTQVVSMFHGQAQTETAVKKALDTQDSGS